MFPLVRGRTRVRRWLLVCSVVAAVVALPGVSASTAYGGSGDFEKWHVSIHIICNSVNTEAPGPATAAPNCPGGIDSGSAGWVEFIRFADGTTQGESHVAIHVHHNPAITSGGTGSWVEDETYTSWRIAPGRAGPQTFYVNGVAVRHGGKTCDHPEENPQFCADQPRNDFMTGISAEPGHFSTDELLPGIPKTPGLNVTHETTYNCYMSDQSLCTNP